MSNFETIRQKLEQFIKKYYLNELLKGAILFFAIGLLYFLFTLFIEYVLWLNPAARTFLFWIFVIVELGLFLRFIAIPLMQLFNLRKGIDYVKASKIIGSHFPEVNDKLLNVLQLNQSKNQSDLLLASIEQKSSDIRPIPFQSAIDFKSNTKYLKYAALPLTILLISWFTGKISWFNDSYERVVNYQIAYEPPAPFQFFIINESLQAMEGKDFKINVTTTGKVIPENAQINFNGQTYFLQSTGAGAFQYVFNLPKAPIEFTLSANDVVSKPYVLDVVNTPNLIGFEMALDFPSYTNKQDELLKSSGSAVIPEGTLVSWRAMTKATTRVNIYAEDTLSFLSTEKGEFQAKKRLFNNYSYSLSTSNNSLSDYENLSYSISVIKDAYPELNIKVQKDSIDQQSLYFYGQASDDYGLHQLNLVYYPSGDESKKRQLPLTVSESNFSEFVSAFPNNIEVEEGQSYELYFEVYDNDALHNFKRTKSSVFSYRKRTETEEEQKQLQEQNNTINNISKTFEKLMEQDKKLEEFSKTQKEKDVLNFNDKKKFEDFLKRQKQQEQLMKNFNKKLQDNLEEFQKEQKKDNQFKEDLKERLKENEAQLKKDEKLLEELEELKDKIDKEDFTQKLEELAKQNKNKKRSMKQLLELTKRFYVMKKAEKIAKQLDQLAEEQKALSEKDKENTKDAQEKLNEKFEELQKDIEELKRDDRQLQKSTNVQTDKFLEDGVKYDQKEAIEALEKKEESESEAKPEASQEQKEKAQQKQKQAAKKMKEMSEKMMQMMSGGGGGGDQMSEDIDMLRQILENLLLYSFDQEGLMDTFESIDIDNNKYGKYIIAQSNLREHFEHIDDSLFALSLRQPKLSEKVNSQITDVYFNIDKALGQLTENRLYQGIASQQYAITASNELASFLSDVLDNMEMSMNPSPGQGGEGMQLPDIIMSQEEIKNDMEEGLKKSEEGKKGSEGEKGEKGKEGEKGEGEQLGEKGEQGEGKQPGEQDGEGQEGSKGKQQGKAGEGGQAGENGEQQGEGNQNGKEDKGGKNGNNGDNGEQNGEGPEEKNDGYGEGGSEEQNAELFKIYQKQQQLRQALENKFAEEDKIESVGQLIRQMEDIELDLLNYGFTNQTLQKMMEVQHQLLKMENATFMQGEDSKRQSETNDKTFIQSGSGQIPTAKSYFNTTEVLNRQALPLQSHLKRKIQDYFKNKAIE